MPLHYKHWLDLSPLSGWSQLKHQTPQTNLHHAGEGPAHGKLWQGDGMWYWASPNVYIGRGEMSQYESTKRPQEPVVACHWETSQFRASFFDNHSHKCHKCCKALKTTYQEHRIYTVAGFRSYTLMDEWWYKTLLQSWYPHQTWRKRASMHMGVSIDGVPPHPPSLSLAICITVVHRKCWNVQYSSHLLGEGLCQRLSSSNLLLPFSSSSSSRSPPPPSTPPPSLLLLVGSSGRRARWEVSWYRAHVLMSKCMSGSQTTFGN